jgi:hypothetical protein
MKGLLKKIVRAYREDTVLWVTIVLGCLALGLPLLGYAVLGYASRHYSDDVCLTSGYLTQGFWRSIVNLYIEWPPRFSVAFVVNISELFGRDAIRWWTAFTLVTWLVSLTLAISEAGISLQFKVHPALAVFFAELAIFFSIVMAPHRYQAFFWRVGIATYTLPLVFLSLLVALILRSARHGIQGGRVWKDMAGIGIAAFFAGGFSETYVALQTSIIILSVAAVLITAKGDTRRGWLSPILSSLVGSLLAMVMVISSPGNAVRLSYLPPRPDIFDFVSMTAKNAFVFFYLALSEYAFVVLLAFSVSLLIAYLASADNDALKKIDPTHLSAALLITPFLAGVLIMAVCAPTAWAESSYPEGRVLIEACHIMVVMILLEGALLGLSLGQLHRWAERPIPALWRLAFTALFLLLCSYAIYDFQRTRLLFPVYQARAALWDDRDTFIRASAAEGIMQVNYPDGRANSFDDFSGLWDLTSLPGFWTNQCAADYYGIESLTVDAPSD